MHRLATFVLIATTALASGGASPASLEPNQDLQALNDRVRELWRQGDLEGAIPPLLAMREALVASGDGTHLPKIDLLLARASAKSGHPAEAVEALARYIEAGHGSVRSIEREPDLEPLREMAGYHALIATLRARQRLAWTSEPADLPLLTLDSPGAPKMEQLRLEQSLDAILEGAADDFERLRRITAWAHSRFGHDPIHAAPAEDPLVILEAAAQAERFRCLEFAIVTAAAATAVGLPARVLSLAVPDVETTTAAAGHVVAEAWLPDQKRWAIADAQFDVVPSADGHPVNAVELQRSIASGTGIQCGTADREACNRYLDFVEPYLHYFMYRSDHAFFTEGSSPRPVLLVPGGAPQPKTFQGNPNPYRGAIPTSNPDLFYAPPPGT